MKNNKTEKNKSKIPEDWLAQARTLSEALPYMKRHSGQTLVIKYGGHAMGDDDLAKQFARDIVLLRQIGSNPVVVHGGGPQIGEMLDRLKVKSEFVEGLRVTDEASITVVEMVLSGNINKQIVSAINGAGGFAVGLSGKDGNLILAEKLRRTKRDPDSNIERILDLGLVGEPRTITSHVLENFEESDITPVIAPIGLGLGVGPCRQVVAGNWCDQLLEAFGSEGEDFLNGYAKVGYVALKHRHLLGVSINPVTPDKPTPGQAGVTFVLTREAGEEVRSNLPVTTSIWLSFV